MRARTITIISLLVCAFAIPASASADPASSDYSRADAITAGLEQSSQSTSGSDYSTVNSITHGDAGRVGSTSASCVWPGPCDDTRFVEDPRSSQPSSGYASLNATIGPSPNQPTFAPGSPSADDGFQWGDAALGAGAAMALVAFGGAALLTVRRRTTVSPSASAS
jgi:hypothetical protein